MITAVVFDRAEMLTLRGVLADQGRGLAQVLQPDGQAPNAGR